MLKRNSCTLFLSLIVLLMMLTGCVMTGGNQPVVDNTYKILKATQIGYDNSMKTVASLHSQGKISDVDKEKVVEAAKVFVASYKLAVKSLEMYAEGTTDQNTVDKSVGDFIEVQSMFVNLVREVISNE